MLCLECKLPKFARPSGERGNFWNYHSDTALFFTSAGSIKELLRSHADTRQNRNLEEGLVIRK